MLRVLLFLLMAAVVGAPAGVAQEPAPATLNVWVLTPATAADKLRIIAQRNQRLAMKSQTLPTTVQTSTAGDFGQVSSNYGQTSGSYGQTASSAGRNASDTGQTAGSYGQTAGSLGTAAGSAGQAAGSYGQTAGSFGQASSNYGSRLDGTPITPAQASRSVEAQRAAARLRFVDAVQDDYVAASVRYLPVIAEELAEKIKAVEGSGDYPDVLVGPKLPEGWETSGLGVWMLGGLRTPDGTDNLQPRKLKMMDAAILRRAPHAEAARAFVIWLNDQAGCASCATPVVVPKSLGDVARTAVSAAGSVWGGGRMGDLADPEAATFNPMLARQLALGSAPAEILDALNWRTDVESVAGNDRLAVVRVRGIATSAHAFGLVHALVVLRRDARGVWRVLQVSANEPPGGLGYSFGLLEAYAEKAPASVALPVSQAAPPDGDVRSPQPDLWWDNSGASKLLVVEWQVQMGDVWSDSRLMMVPDAGGRLQTRATATFARVGGEYKWRVWSLGMGGSLAMTSWKKLVIVK